MEYSHHEAAISQHEIDMRYDDALKMADNMVTYRLTVKEVATQHGVYATFMPKPLNDEYGSGMHTHQSLLREILMLSLMIVTLTIYQMLPVLTWEGFLNILRK